jgi:hypothetical protein
MPFLLRRHRVKRSWDLLYCYVSIHREANSCYRDADVDESIEDVTFSKDRSHAYTIAEDAENEDYRVTSLTTPV